VPEIFRRRGVLRLGLGAAIGASTAAVDSSKDARAAYLGKDSRGVIYGPNGFPGPLSVSNDPDWAITNLPNPLGDFTAGLASRFVNPNPSDAASGGLVNAAVVAQVEGAATAQPRKKLFLDAFLVRLGLRSYNDSAVTSFASATGVELDLAIDGDGNAVQHLYGYYVVPILGQVNAGGVSGHIKSMQMIRTDSIQGGANAAGLHIENLIGIYASRPSKDNHNLSVGVQYSLVAEPGTMIYTDSAEKMAWLGIGDIHDPTNVIWLRINASRSLEFCKTDGSVIATLTDAGALTVNTLTAEHVVASAETWRSVTSPPESGTAYQNTTGVGADLSANYTPGNGAGDIMVELSPDGATWRTWLDQSFADSAAAAQVLFRCPFNWYYRITLTGAGAVLGALNAFG